MNTDLIKPEPADPWPERKRELRESEWRLYEKLIAKCELGIDRLLTEPDETLSACELTRLIDLAERIGRLAVGLPKDNAAQDFDGGDDRARRREIAAAIKTIYSQPIEAIAIKMACVPQPIDVQPNNSQ